jgi:hypothetical protein
MESGELAQIMNGEVISLITYLELLRESPKPRGHHYHLNKHEILYFISGKVEAVYWDLDSDLMASVIPEAGHLVRIAPRCAHVYRVLEYAQALELGSAPFDASDTYPTTVDMTYKK